jgi:hypothetical protein
MLSIPMAAIRVTTRRPPGKHVPSLAVPVAVTATGAVAGLAVLRGILKRLR